MRSAEHEPLTHSGHRESVLAAVPVEAGLGVCNERGEELLGFLFGGEEAGFIADVDAPLTAYLHWLVSLHQVLICDSYIHTGGTEITRWKRKPTMAPKMPVAQHRRTRFAAVSCQ